MIEINSVSKIYNKARPNEFSALKDVSLMVRRGNITVLKGPSGSGKTTLLSIVGCMARPSSGRIWVRDQEITSLPERFLTEVRRKTFGFIFQHFNLIKGITVLENVMLPAYPEGIKRSVLKKQALTLLDMFDLGSKASSHIEWLSGGEAQRAAIARALINDPSVIIADEPTAHLDTKLSSEFMDTMHKLREDGRTILIASHDPIVYTSKYAEEVIEMRDGGIVPASPGI